MIFSPRKVILDAELERLKARLKETLKSLDSDPEFFELAASCAKKFYDSLVSKGFTDAQATWIVSGQGMGVKIN